MNTNRSDDSSVGRFREASMELDAAYSLFAKTCGLSVTEYWSLLLVSQGIRTQSELSAHLSISKQTLNSAVIVLKRKGLIRLDPSENSQRVKIVRLTGTGWQFIREHISVMHQTEAAGCRRAGFTSPVKSTVSRCGAPSISVTSFTGSSFAEARSFWPRLTPAKSENAVQRLFRPLAGVFTLVNRRYHTAGGR